MKIAFDWDGTITRHPRVLIDLATSLQNQGHDVFILTAAAGEFPPDKRPAEVARRVASYGASHLPIVCIESSQKPVYCAANGVHLLIDDTQFKGLVGTVQLIPHLAVAGYVG